jgi:hypothetical protein
VLVDLEGMQSHNVRVFDFFTLFPDLYKAVLKGGDLVLEEEDPML